MSSHILDLQFPSDLSSVELSVLAGLNTDAGEDSQCCAWWADRLISDLSDGCEHDIGLWTAPAWAAAGDTAWFMLAKTAGAKIRKAQNALDRHGYAPDPRALAAMEAALQKARENHRRYGGLVFAKGTVLSSTEKIEPVEGQSWGSTIYAHISSARLVGPIEVLSMEPLVRINRFGGITRLSDEAAAYLEGAY